MGSWLRSFSSFSPLRIAFVSPVTSGTSATGAVAPKTSTPQSKPVSSVVVNEPAPAIAVEVGLSGAVVPKSRPLVGGPATRNGN